MRAIDFRDTAAYSAAVFRILFVLALLSGAPLLAQGPAPNPAPPPQRAAVFSASDASAVVNYVENESLTRGMTDQLVMAVTGKPEVRAAWSSLVKPTDRVGIKVSTAGGKYFSSHKGIVAAVCAGLESAGVPRAGILIWDRQSEELRAAGYAPVKGGYQVRGIDPPKGWDPKAKVTAPVMGKLIWGDLLFRGKPEKLTRRWELEEDQLTADSYLATVLSQEVTKVINIATLSDEAGCGVAGAVYNMTVPNVDNNRRFTQGPAAYAMSDVYLDPRVGPKVVMHFLDGLVAQYAGGPKFSPNYAFAHGTIYASRDPLALDATAAALLDGWRKEAKLPPLGRRVQWLTDAEQGGVGIANRDRIDLKPVPAHP